MRIMLAAATACVAHAAPSNGLYGMGFYAQTFGQFVLQKYSVNGTGTNMGRPLNDEYVGQQLSDIDQSKGIYYYIGLNSARNISELVGLSLTDGSILSRTKLPYYTPYQIGLGQTLAANGPAGSVLIGGQMTDGGAHEVGTFVPGSGQYTPLASFDPSLKPIMGGLSGYSPKANRYLVALGSGPTVQNWYWVDLATKQTGSYSECDLLESIDWDASRNVFVGVGVDVNTRTRMVASLDALSGKCTLLGKVPGYLEMFAGQATLDASTGNIWALMQPSGDSPTAPYDLVGIRTKGGPVSIFSNFTLEKCPNVIDCPWQLEYFYGA